MHSSFRQSSAKIMAMISLINHRDILIAERIYYLQQASYAIERDLIAYPDFPPLQVSAQDIQTEPDIFLGHWDKDHLVGVVSFTKTSELLDIGRLIIHPSYFRRGIASALLESVEGHATPQQQITVSTAEKNHPAVKLYLKHGYQLSKRTELPDGLILVRFTKSMNI